MKTIFPKVFFACNAMVEISFPESLTTFGKEIFDNDDIQTTFSHNSATLVTRSRFYSRQIVLSDQGFTI